MGCSQGGHRAELREVGPWEGAPCSQQLLLFWLEVHQLEQPDWALAQRELCQEGRGRGGGEREGELTPGHPVEVKASITHACPGPAQTTPWRPSAYFLYVFIDGLPPAHPQGCKVPRYSGYN